jgi:hypothetical protein
MVKYNRHGHHLWRQRDGLQPAFLDRPQHQAPALPLRAIRATLTLAWVR